MTAMTLKAEDYEAALLGDAFRNIQDLIDLFGRFDLSKLGELAAAVRNLFTAKTLTEQVRAGLGVLRSLASMTPTEADDKVLATIDSILTDKIIAIIERLVRGMVGKAHIADVTITAADRKMAMLVGIPWSFLVKVALYIAQLLDRLNIGAQSPEPVAE
jgi:hypothetical protein